MHTNRVSLMHSVVCIVYVERYVQTIHIPFDTPASEVFSRPSTQIPNFVSRVYVYFALGTVRSLRILQAKQAIFTKNRDFRLFGWFFGPIPGHVG